MVILYQGCTETRTEMTVLDPRACTNLSGSISLYAAVMISLLFMVIYVKAVNLHFFYRSHDCNFYSSCGIFNLILIIELKPTDHHFPKNVCKTCRNMFKLSRLKGSIAELDDNLNFITQ